eukprot:m51a1_g5543 hypothetical protein (402) ;mRNA; r:483674-485068
MYWWWGFLIYFGVLVLLVALVVAIDRRDTDDTALELRPHHALARIVVSQALYYFWYFLVVFGFDLCFQERFRVSQVFDWRECEFGTDRGRVTLCAGILASLAFAVGVVPVEKNSKQVMDYAFTAHVVHFVAVVIETRRFPARGAWWVSHLVGAGASCALCFAYAYRMETLSMPSERARTEDREVEATKLERYEEEIRSGKRIRRLSRSVYRASRKFTAPKWSQGRSPSASPRSSGEAALPPPAYDDGKSDREHEHEHEHEHERGSEAVAAVIADDRSIEKSASPIIALTSVEAAGGSVPEATTEASSVAELQSPGHDRQKGRHVRTASHRREQRSSCESASTDDGKGSSSHEGRSHRSDHQHREPPSAGSIASLGDHSLTPEATRRQGAARAGSAELGAQV